MLSCMALSAIAWAACGGSSSEPKEPKVAVPERIETTGDAILKMIPSGADSILEIDFERLRTNTVVGELARSLTRVSQVSGQDGGVNLATMGDFVTFVSYGIGEPNPERVVVVRGGNAAAIKGSFRLDGSTVALVSKKMESKLALVAAGRESSLAEASELTRLRALAMPDKASGAVLRVAAHLDFNARIALAKALDVDEVPVSVSVWGDVADDLAIIALVSGENAKEGGRLAGALAKIRSRLAGQAMIRRFGVGRLLRGAKIENHGAAARMVLLIGPRRLKRLVERILAQIAASDAA